MASLIKRLYRERRRAVAVTLLLGGVVALGHDLSGTAVLGTPGALALHVAGWVGAGMALPRIRVLVETSATIWFVVALSNLSFATMAPEAGGLQSLVTIALIFGIVWAFMSSGLDRLLPRRTWHLHSRATSQLAPQTLLDGLTRTPDHLPANPKGDLHATWAAPGQMRLDWRDSATNTITELRTPRKVNGTQSATLDYALPKASPDFPGRAGAIRYDLIARATGTALSITQTVQGQSPRAQILMWIDDTLGREEDRLIAHLERAAA